MSRKQTKQTNIYLEVGSRRTFAAALDWPGWCRMGRDEETALQALLEYGPRYAQVLRRARLGFQVPSELTAFTVVERLKGSATTDFGAPGMVPSSDEASLNEAELRRLQSILKACWRALDAAVEKAEGHALQTGPRGGGRSLDKIVGHVLGAEAGYLSALGGKAPKETSPTSREPIRQAILKTIKASAQGEIPAAGPRGGKRWPPRYFVRREAWHVLDHAWEIEDRLQEA